MVCKRMIWMILGLWAMHVHAEYRELDAIVAIVDDDVVLASELLSRLKDVQAQIERSDRQPPPQEVLINQLMERLILENLQLRIRDRLPDLFTDLQSGQYDGVLEASTGIRLTSLLRYVSGVVPLDGYIVEHGEDMPEIRNWKWGAKK